MKKYLLLLIALIPFTVFAQNYTIKTKVGVEGKTIEEGEFVFNLLDKDGNVVQTKKNDKDGNIVFDPISWNSNGVTTSYDKYGQKTGSYKTDSSGRVTQYDKYGRKVGTYK